MKLDITKKVSLDYLGEGWEKCYLEFRLPSYGDLSKLTVSEGTDAEKVEKGLETIVGLFKSGLAISEGKETEVKGEDIRDFPIEVITKCFKAISGEVDPK
jgi:hypothetical protein